MARVHQSDCAGSPASIAPNISANAAPASAFNASTCSGARPRLASWASLLSKDWLNTNGSSASHLTRPPGKITPPRKSGDVTCAYTALIDSRPEAAACSETTPLAESPKTPMRPFDHGCRSTQRISASPSASSLPRNRLKTPSDWRRPRTTCTTSAYPRSVASVQPTSSARASILALACSSG